MTLYLMENQISIHTPLAGSDISNPGAALIAHYFSPHSPRGE